MEHDDAVELGDEDRDQRGGRPPYLFLIPVGLGILAFVGYQTVRIGAIGTNLGVPVAQASVPAYLRPLDQAMPTIVSVHAKARPRKAAAVVAMATPSAAPSASAPAASPTPGPRATAAAEHPHRIALAHPHVKAPSKIAFASVPDSRPTPDDPSARAQTAEQPPQTLVKTAVVAASPAAGSPTAAPAAAANPSTDRIADAKMVYAAPPDYPEMARDQGASGRSVVYVTVNGSGAIEHVSVAYSSGNVLLDRAAVAAANGSRYVAPKLDGKPTTQTYRVVYDFSP